jgi:ankyrin repeat protein
LVNRESFDEKKALKLIQIEAYVEVRNNDTQTLLHFTVKNGCIHCIEELIKAGAYVNAKIAEGRDNWTPFH